MKPQRTRRNAEGFEKMKNGWTETVFGEVCKKPQYGFTASAERDCVGPKLLRITDITELGVNWNSVPHCKCPQSTVPAYRLEHNDILVARIGATTGKSFIVKTPPLAVFASYLIRLRVHPEICPDYLFYSLQTAGYWSQIRANKDKNLKGGVNATILSSLALSLPSLPEQKKIAAVLLKIQRAIETQEKIIQSLRDLKKSAMQYLFTHGLRGEKTKMTEIGEIPESWEVVPLRSIAFIKGGKRLPRGKQLSPQPTPYPYIRVTDLRDNSVLVEQLLFVPEDVQPAIARYIIQKEDIYISIAGTTGIVGVIPDELDGAQLTENAAKIILKSDDVIQYFVMRLLDSSTGQFQIANLTTKTSQPKLALARIKLIQIPLPKTVEEQEDICFVVDGIDNKLRSSESKKSVLQDLFKTTLNKLMTRKIRVNDLDIDVREVGR